MKDLPPQNYPNSWNGIEVQWLGTAMLEDQDATYSATEIFRHLLIGLDSLSGNGSTQIRFQNSYLMTSMEVVDVIPVLQVIASCTFVDPQNSYDRLTAFLCEDGAIFISLHTGIDCLQGFYYQYFFN